MELMLLFAGWLVTGGVFAFGLGRAIGRLGGESTGVQETGTEPLMGEHAGGESTAAA